jgi:phage terminase large subunit-like protein
VIDKIRAGTKSRKNALIFEITNSGYDRHSVCWVHHDFSLKVLEGIYKNDSWFAYLATLDDGDDWRNPKVWIKANPGLGHILPMKYLREQVEEALSMPSKENLVKRLNFCQWTEQSIRWLPMPIWDKGAEPFDVDALRGRKCYGGLDLARVHDLSAFGLVFPPQEDDERWKCLVWFWIPEDDMAVRSNRDHVPYDVWVRDGYIKATGGNVTDFGYIEQDIVELAGIYDIREIAFDRTFAGEIVQSLMAEGLTMVEFGQGFYSMASPTAEFERMIKGEKLQHGGNPVLRWNASNVSVAQDAAGNIKPDKEHSIEKIDGIVALIMGVGRAIVENSGNKSVYEERGIITL